MRERRTRALRCALKPAFVQMMEIGGSACRLIRRAFIDSGFRPGKKDEVPEHRVYEFCRRHARIAYAVKGFDHRDQPLSVKRIG